MTEMTELAERFCKGIEAGDIEVVKECYSPDVVVWHNFDRRDQSRDENLASLAWFLDRVEALRYEEVRRVVHAEGFVQQHILRGRTPAGVELEAPVCLVAEVAGGRITRLEEYLDSAQLAALAAAGPGA
ncbi:MAG TPA: nuclear transport factor 2 family protein [Acidimicrobiales bacterium]